METKMRGYALCGNPRVGSTFLSEALTATGKLGLPKEYFNANGRRHAGDVNYPISAELQIKRILSDGITSNGVYGVKLFTHHFDRTNELNWAALLPNLSYVFLQRRDLLMQAISYERAEQSKQWTSRHKNKMPEVYNGHGISEKMKLCALGEARWQLFFARNGITPLRLVYEEVTLDMCKYAVSEVAKLCAVQGLKDFNYVPNLVKQRDEISDDWRKRFIQENGNLSYLDTYSFTRRFRTLKKVITRAYQVKRDIKRLIKISQRQD